MPNPTTKTRQAIKNRFVRNAIPTQADFADLIDASLNQADDGLLKLPNEPLGLVRQQPDKPVLRFYDSPDATESAWQIYLSADSKAGFALVNTDKDGAISSRLFLDAVSGNVGIGTTKADAKLTVQGGIEVTDNIRLAASKEILFTDNGQIRSADNNHRLLFRRSENIMELREYGRIILSAGSTGGTETASMVVLENGNASIKGNLTVRGSGVKDPDSRMSGVGQLAIKGISPQIDFIDADSNDWSIHVNSNKMYFIRQPWEYKDLVLDGAGNVGIGTDSPAARLQITGNVSIASAEGQNFACKSNYMAPGSLTIGGIDRNYGGGNNWNSSTAGLLLEALDNTEIAIHDAGVRLASFMYYEGAKNQFTIGRDMGWGAISTVIVPGTLQAAKIKVTTDTTSLAALTTTGNIDMSTDAFCLDSANKSVGIGTKVSEPGWRLDVLGNTRIRGIAQTCATAIRQSENSMQLEVYSPDTKNSELYTKIRFHQHNQYWAWLGYHREISTGEGEFVFWDLNQERESKIRVGTIEAKGDLVAKGAVVRSIWAGSGNGPGESLDMGRLNSRTIRITKLFRDTALRIVYCDNFRVSGNDVACRWEIRVDGNSVNPPILADRYESSGNRHLHGTVMGYARGIAAGAHEIQVWIVAHPHNQGRGTDADTGWAGSTWSLEAEEVWLA